MRKGWAGVGYLHRRSLYDRLMPPEACAAGLKNVEYSTKLIAAGQKVCDELIQKILRKSRSEQRHLRARADRNERFSSEEM